MIQYALTPVLGLLAALLGAAALAEPATPSQPADWLVRMAQAVRTQNYEGVLVYAQGAHMESMRIVHRYQDGREQERLQALSGDAREIHRTDDVVTCILPKDRAVKLDRRSFRGLLPEFDETAVGSVSEHYEFVDLGRTQLVGRSCRAVSVKPRDAFRYGYRMWIDEETDVPLKVELLGPDGATLEQIMFTQISYPAQIDDSEFKPDVDTSRFVWIRHKEPPAATPSADSSTNWVVGALPPGFRMVAHQQQTMPDTPAPVEHMVFTDGLATVSAFMAPQGVSRKLKGLSRRGAVTVFARMVDDFHVTVVGEVPQATVEQIAGQLHYDRQQAPGASATTLPTQDE